MIVLLHKSWKLIKYPSILQFCKNKVHVPQYQCICFICQIQAIKKQSKVLSWSLKNPTWNRLIWNNLLKTYFVDVRLCIFPCPVLWGWWTHILIRTIKIFMSNKSCHVQKRHRGSCHLCGTNQFGIEQCISTKMFHKMVNEAFNPNHCKISLSPSQLVCPKQSRKNQFQIMGHKFIHPNLKDLCTPLV